jgi:protein phosphatase 2C family protein 2/3
VQNGGQVYQTTTAQSLEPDPAATKGKGKNSGPKGQNPGDPKAIKWSEPEYVIGPIRVLPGRLSVSRTFGDPEAKLAYRGGNMNVVKAEPEIRQFQIHKNHDFIMLASDGVFDKMSNEDISKCVWESCDKNKWQANPNYRPAQSVHQQCGLAVESVLKNSLYR